MWQQQQQVVDSSTKLKAPAPNGAAAGGDGRVMQLLMKASVCMSDVLDTSTCNQAACPLTPPCHNATQQVNNQRWLTVGAFLVLGGAALLAADAVRCPRAHTLARQAVFVGTWLHCAVHVKCGVCTAHGPNCCCLLQPHLCRVCDADGRAACRTLPTAR